MRATMGLSRDLVLGSSMAMVLLVIYMTGFVGRQTMSVSRGTVNAVPNERTDNRLQVHVDKIGAEDSQLVNRAAVASQNMKALVASIEEDDGLVSVPAGSNANNSATAAANHERLFASPRATVKAVQAQAEITKQTPHADPRSRSVPELTAAAAPTKDHSSKSVVPSADLPAAEAVPMPVADAAETTANGKVFGSTTLTQHHSSKSSGDKKVPTQRVGRDAFSSVPRPRPHPANTGRWSCSLEVDEASASSHLRQYSLQSASCCVTPIGTTLHVELLMVETPASKYEASFVTSAENTKLRASVAGRVFAMPISTGARRKRNFIVALDFPMTSAQYAIELVYRFENGRYWDTPRSRSLYRTVRTLKNKNNSNWLEHMPEEDRRLLKAHHTALYATAPKLILRHLPSGSDAVPACKLPLHFFDPSWRRAARTPREANATLTTTVPLLWCDELATGPGGNGGEPIGAIGSDIRGRVSREANLEIRIFRAGEGWSPSNCRLRRYATNITNAPRLDQKSGVRSSSNLSNRESEGGKASNLVQSDNGGVWSSLPRDMYIRFVGDSTFAHIHVLFASGLFPGAPKINIGSGWGVLPSGAKLRYRYFRGTNCGDQITPFVFGPAIIANESYHRKTALPGAPHAA